MLMPKVGLPLDGGLPALAQASQRSGRDAGLSGLLGPFGIGRAPGKASPWGPALVIPGQDPKPRTGPREGKVSGSGNAESPWMQREAALRACCCLERVSGLTATVGVAASPGGSPAHTLEVGQGPARWSVCPSTGGSLLGRSRLLFHFHPRLF